MKFPESMRQREARLKDLVADYLEAVGASQAKTLRAEDLERLKLKLAAGTRTATRKPASINRYPQDLKAMFCKAVDSGKVGRHPFNGVDLLTENNKRTRELSPEEEFRLFETLPGDPPALRPYFRFLLETGARAGEACDLTWPAILWADGVAELPETKVGEKQYLSLSKAALEILKALPKNGPHVSC